MIKVSVVSTKDIWKYIIKIGVIVATLFIILKIYNYSKKNFETKTINTTQCISYITDERELEDGTLRDIDLEVTVGIGHSTVRGTFLNDPGANEPCTVLVKDGTFYMDGL